MGQGYSMTALSAAAVTIDVPELTDLTHEKTLASARFMKSVRARNQQGYVFVKAVQKPYAAFDVRSYVKQIADERNILAGIPNALGYQRIIEVGNAGYLVRQYMFSSVYDRLSTRPFLETIERKWLAFQLLCAVRDCHARNIYHGDIKTENLLVTSWNWLFLTDFSASFKPTSLPEDNPADFFFYFDTSGRRICYIAPERFTTNTTEDVPTELNWAMDMFSVGCTIAEIFLESPIFSLSQIFKYRAGEYSPEHTHINKIEDEDVRDMILNMIELDPEKRYSAEQILSFYKGKIFPDYFYGFLHQYMQDLTEISSSHHPIELDMGILAESDAKIEKVYQDFDKISFFLGYSSARANSTVPHRKRSASNSMNPSSGLSTEDSVAALNDGTLLFLTIVSSSLRTTAKASARLRACDLLVSFASRLPDEAKLDRILPYVAGLLTDQSDIVKVAALQAVTRILETVETVSPINAYLFPEYIFPKLKPFIFGSQGRPTPLVRAAYACCVAPLALSSARMLDMVQAIRADGRIPALSQDEWAPDASYHGLYDVARAELIPHFEEAATALITDPEVSVRRALLSAISRLCIFFGSTKSSDVILSHLNTYLNDKDWLLRCSFFEALVGVGLYVGSSSLEKFILPIMIGSMTDPEPFVVEKVMRSLARMASLGLLRKQTTWELASITSRYLIHPSIWLREAAVQFIVQSSRFLSAADKYSIMMPILQPFLNSQVLDLEEESILDHLKAPLSRAVFDAAMQWASKKDKSLFWTAASRDAVFSLSDGEATSIPVYNGRRLATRIAPSQRDRDDQTALETLRNLGLTPDDEIKLLALREYILRVATRKTEETAPNTSQFMSNIIPLTQIGVTPQNVFFDQREPVREVRKEQRNILPGENLTRHTLTDALLDASTTVNETTADHARQGYNNNDSIVPPRTLPIDIQGDEDKVKAVQFGSPDRTSSRIQNIKAGDLRRASSVTGRHALLDSDRLAARRDSQGLPHRHSAVNLLTRAETIKADAEISTTPETAFGTLDAQLQKRSSAAPFTTTLAAEAVENGKSRLSKSRNTTTTSLEANYSYTGNDPHVLKLLDNHFIENFPIDLLDFGQPRPSADTATPIKRVSDHAYNAKSDATGEAFQLYEEPWRPSGQLLTQFAEHTAAITRLVAAPDHAFFVSASDDGTCKVWDTTRLEKNITPRSRYTHRHAPGTKIKSVCFVEGTHTFISAADDGSLQAVRVDYRSVDGGESTRYGRPQLVRDYHIVPLQAEDDVKNDKDHEQHEHAVWLHHYRTQTSQSILLVATSKCRILVIDLKNMEVLHSMENPVAHGIPTVFCVDKKHHWLLLGTSHGILDLWDLRFKLRIRAFGIGGAGQGKRIDRLFVHPSKGHGRYVIVSCGGEISVWDIEKMICREVLRPSTFVQGKESKSVYDAWSVEENSGKDILHRFARNVQDDAQLIGPEPRVLPSTASATGTPTKDPPNTEMPTTTVTSPSIPALHVLIDYLANPSQPSNPNKTAVLFSAGADRTIRHWDLAHIDQSGIVSGPMINIAGGEGDLAGKVRVRYESSWPTSMSLSGLIQLVEEKVGISGRPADDGTPRKSKRPGGMLSRAASGMTATSANTTSTTSPTKATAGGSSGSKSTRSSIISAAQQQMLRTHMDAITDVIVLKRPYGCVVSGDRMGSIMIFH